MERRPEEPRERKRLEHHLRMMASLQRRKQAGRVLLALEMLDVLLERWSRQQI